MAFRQGDPGYVENRDEIVAAILAQMYGAAGAGGDQPYPYNLLGGNGAPGTPAGFGTGFTSSSTGQLSDSASNPAGTFGGVLGNPAAGMPSPSMNAPSMSDLTQAAVPGDFGAAPAAQAQGQPAGLPAGFFSTGFNNAQAAPGPVAQGLQIGGVNLGGYQIGDQFGSNLESPGYSPASGFIAASQFAPGPPTGYFSNQASVPGDPANPGNPAPAPSPDITGPTAAPTGTPASTGNVAVDVGIGIGMGFGGATGDGTSGSTAASDAAGVGTTGNSTGISGGPGGTGEGGANTGEGGGGGGGAGGGSK